MKQNETIRSHTRGIQSSTLPRLLLLALFFVGGVLLGQMLAERVPGGTGNELHRYLADFVQLGGQEPSIPKAAFSTLLVYYRYPLLAFLLGFASVGIVLLPFAACACGFFLSFSVCCFTAAFGGNGVLLALSIFGLRCLIMLPCFFLLAVPAWGTSASLAAISFGRGRRTAPVLYGKPYWTRLGITAAVLFLGVCAELFLSPALLRLAAERILVG